MSVSERTHALREALYTVTSSWGYNFGKALRRDTFDSVLRETKYLMADMPNNTKQQLVDAVADRMRPRDAEHVRKSMESVLEDVMVYVTSSGGKYHAAHCRYGKCNAGAKMIGRSVAMALGKTACKICKPDGVTNTKVERPAHRPPRSPVFTPTRELSFDVESDFSDDEAGTVVSHGYASVASSRHEEMAAEMQEMRRQMMELQQRMLRAEGETRDARADRDKAIALRREAEDRAREAEAEAEMERLAAKDMEAIVDEEIVRRREKEAARAERRAARAEKKAARSKGRAASPEPPAVRAPSPAAGPAVPAHRYATRSRTAAVSGSVIERMAGAAKAASEAVAGMMGMGTGDVDDDAASVDSGVSLVPPAASVSGRAPVLVASPPAVRRSSRLAGRRGEAAAPVAPTPAPAASGDDTVWVRKAGGSGKWHLKTGGCHLCPKGSGVDVMMGSQLSAGHKCKKCVNKLG